MPCHDYLPAVELNRISAVSILSGEHRVILQVLDVLQRLADLTRDGGRIPEAHARQVLEVLRTFADTCHHGKEEDILFPALEALVPGFGPTQVMRAEHVDGRIHIKAMGAAVESQQPAAYVQHAQSYIDLLRQHIDKEDGILFRMAQSMLSPAQDLQLIAEFRKAEHDDMGSGTHERMLGIADALADAYGIPRASADPRVFTLLTACCGCHEAQP